MKGQMDGLTEQHVESRACNTPSTIKPVLGELRMNLNVFLKAEML